MTAQSLRPIRARLLSLLGLTFLAPCGQRGCGGSGREGRRRRARGPGSAAGGQGRDPPRREVRRRHARRPASASSMSTAPTARSSCPKRWAPGSRSSTTTTTAIRTSCSSTRAHWPGHENKAAPAPTQALYRNDGKGHFEDVTKQAGLDKTFYGQGVAVGDYDNDGDLDVYITAIGGGHLFRNDGKGHFDDVTAAANAQGSQWLAHRRDVPRHRQ